MNYQGGYGGGGGGNSGQQQYGGEGMGMGSGGGTNSHYDPSEVLSDAIATVSFCFSRFCTAKRIPERSIISSITS
jgi:hypothetical protein